MTESLVKTQAKAVFEWGPVQAIARALRLGTAAGHAIQEYHSWRTRLTRSRGKAAAVMALKDLHSRRKLASLGVQVSRRPYGGLWIKTNRLGLPTCLPALTQLLEGGVWRIR
jgi:uncharacterized membrane protein